MNFMTDANKRAELASFSPFFYFNSFSLVYTCPIFELHYLSLVLSLCNLYVACMYVFFFFLHMFVQSCQHTWAQSNNWKISRSTLISKRELIWLLTGGFFWLPTSLRLFPVSDGSNIYSELWGLGSFVSHNWHWGNSFQVAWSRVTRC